MMNDLMFDKQIKDKLKMAKCRVPSKITTAVEETVNQLPQKKRKFILYRPIKVAAVLCALLLCFAITVSAYAGYIPGLKSIFGIFALQNNMINEINKGYLDYAQPVNQSVTLNGYTFTIEDVVADANRLIYSLSISSKSKLPKNIDNYFIHTSINDITTSSGGSREGEFKDDYNYKIVHVEELVGNEVPQVYDLKLKLINFEGVEDEAIQFNIKVDTTKISKATKVITYKKGIEVPNSNCLLKKITISPISTGMEFFADEKSDISPSWSNCIVLDDKGNQIRVATRGSGTDAKGSNGIRVAMEKIRPDTEYLTIIPYSTSFPSGGLKDNQYKHIFDLNTKLPIVVNQGSFGSLTINKIDQEGDTLAVHYIVDGKYPYLQADSVALCNEEGVAIVPENRFFTKTENNFRENIALFKVNKDTQLKLVVLSMENDYKVYEDSKKNIPLKSN